MHQELVLDIRRDALGNKFLHFPAMFISDLHLGTIHSRAKRLSHALQRTIADQLYCVGDIFDGECMLKKKRWDFGEWHRQVIAHVCRKADNESKVFYIPGNHDEGIRYKKITQNGQQYLHRNLCGKTVYGINIDVIAFYTALNGHVFKVIHGDQYDHTWGYWSSIGDAVLEMISQIDTWFQRFPRCGHISLAAKGKRVVKKFVDKVWSIRKHIAEDVDRDPSLHGIITGHSHMSEISRTPGGKLRLNDGCCTEHVEILVQDKNGVWAILEWHQTYLKITQEIGPECDQKTNNPQIHSWEKLGLDAFVNPAELIEGGYTEKADRIIRLCYRMWPPKERQMTKAVKPSHASNDHTLSTGYIPLPHSCREKRFFQKMKPSRITRSKQDQVVTA